jgi:hypothetical protein
MPKRRAFRAAAPRGRGALGRLLRREVTLSKPTHARGRPTEETAPVSTALGVRLTVDEMAQLRALADAQGVPVSRLLRRAVREMVNGAPDPFDDGVLAMREAAKQLAAIGRNLNQLVASVNSGDYAYATDIIASVKDVRAAVEEVRGRYARLVEASRKRWVTVKGQGGRSLPALPVAEPMNSYEDAAS